MGDLFDRAIGVLQQPEAVATLRDRAGATETAVVGHAVRLAVPVTIGHLRRWIDDEDTSERLLQIVGSIDPGQIAEPGPVLAAGADQSVGARLTRPLVADRALVARIGAAIGDETGIGAAAATGLLVPAAWAVAGVLVQSVGDLDRAGLADALAAEEHDLLDSGRRRWLDPTLLPERTRAVPEPSESTAPPAMPSPLPVTTAPTMPDPILAPATVTELRPGITAAHLVDAAVAGAVEVEPVPEPLLVVEDAGLAPSGEGRLSERPLGRPDGWQLGQAEVLPPLSQSTVTVGGSRTLSAARPVASTAPRAEAVAPTPAPPTVGPGAEAGSLAVDDRLPQPAPHYASGPPPPDPGARRHRVAPAERMAGRPDPGLVDRPETKPRRRGWPGWLLALIVLVALAVGLAVLWLIDPTLFGLR